MAMNMETDRDKYGIEIEFCTDLPIQVICETLGVNDSCDLGDFRNMFFNIGTDETVNTDMYQGFELRTPIFYEFPTFDLSTYLSKLKQISHIHDLCGLHIHASGPSFIYLSLLEEYGEFYKICKTLYNKFKPKIQRSHFCSVGPIEFTAYKKYRAIRKITEDHWEFRVFNSSFNIDYILNCFQAVLDLRDNCDGKNRT